jgi:hypothetical protein
MFISVCIYLIYIIKRLQLIQLAEAQTPGANRRLEIDYIQSSLRIVNSLETLLPKH